MSNPMEEIQRALTIRLGLQMSLSQLPIVEEAMDLDFSRWIDHVPMPPELPQGTKAHWEVTIGSDLSRVTWGAYGAPRGFIPKLSKYFDKCGATKVDIDILNQIGGALQPSLVGSWVGVEGGAIQTGWQFREHRPMAELEEHLGAGPATAKLLGWVQLTKVTTFRRFTQAIRKPTSDIELVMPGDTASAQVAAARTGFEQMFGEELPSYVVDAATAAGEADVSLAVRISDNTLSRVSLLMPYAGNDVVASLCSAAGISFDDGQANVQKALQANGASRIEYRVVGDARHVDLIVIPGSGDHPRAPKN